MVSNGSNSGSRIETIDEAFVERYLARNTCNRPHLDPASSLIASAITRGEWVVNGESIVISDQDELLDGQHRLHAVRKAKRPVQSYVVRGIPRAAFRTFDLGRVRSLADTFFVEKEAHHRTLATASRLQAGWDKGLRATALHYKVTPLEGELVLGRHPGLRDATGFAHRHNGLRPLIPLGYLAFLFYNGARSHTPAEAGSFWDSVESGAGLQEGDPALTLRNRLIQGFTQNSGLGRRITPTARLAYSIKAWNAHVRGDSMQLLKLGSNEDFPEFAQP